MILFCSKLIKSTSSNPVNNGAIVVKRGIIIARGPLQKIKREFPGEPIIPLERAVLLPGLVNVHTHLELPSLLDSVRSRTFPEWVLNLIQAKKGLHRGGYRQAADLNIRNLIHTGTTTVGEISTHRISPGLLAQSGLRSVVFHEIISMNPLSPVPRFPALLSRPSGLTRSGLSPHAPHTVSKKVLSAIRTFAAKRNVPLCMHVAESKDEIRLLQGKKSGFEKLYAMARWDRDWAPKADSSFAYLNELGLLNPRFLAVHGVQATDADISLIKRTGTAIAHCPRSNKETKVGRLQLKTFLDKGIVVGLGTDSLASSPSLSMWDEMRYALKIHGREGVSAKDLFTIGTIGGAKALGLEKEVGTLEPGKRADIIAVPLPRKDTGDIYSDLLRETNSCIMTMVNGKILYRR